MPNVVIWLALAALGAGALFVGALFAARHRTYLRHLRYDPKQDCAAPFSTPAVEQICLRCNPEGFVLPELPSGVAGGLLELDVRAALAGAIFDPWVEIETGSFRDTLCLERGVHGTRYLNVSRLLNCSVGAGATIAIRGHRLAWRPASARLHVCRERPQPSDRVLVISPHPDDAEIAAFGLYSDTKAAVVTVSAGDGSDRYTGDGGLTLRLPRTTVARMRVWDSISVPQLGGVPPEKAVNLCYQDGRLGEMHAEPARDFRGDGGGALDFAGMRRLNLSGLVRADAGVCSWESLVADLAYVFAETKPTVVVTPHPWLDPHSDHAFTTLAVCEALRVASVPDGRFYFYVNHNRRSELWPFGPAGSGVALLPILASDVVGCEGFYSHPLSPERQRDKFVALEAMHDLRDIGAPEPLPAGARVRRLRAEVSALLNGMGSPPTSYLRRAVRPDELFLVTSFERGEELCRKSFPS